MIITNSRYALVGYFITSYPTRAHGIIVIYLPRKLHSLESSFQGGPASDRLGIWKCRFCLWSGAHTYRLEPSSPALGPGVDHYPSRFIFRTSLKGRLRNNGQIANQRRAMAAVALCHLPTRESMTKEKSSKNNCTRGKD